MVLRPTARTLLSESSYAGSNPAEPTKYGSEVKVVRHWIVAPGNRVQLSTLPPIWGHRISVIRLHGMQ